MFEFVGVLGARYLVDFFENGLFNRFVNPFFTRLLEFFPALLRDMFVGRYGIISMAVTYGLAIVLPITATFFLFFAFLEDCGYLPRLAFLLDRMMKPLGLTGKAVLPLTLGLGCCTMATLTTRILETRKEKLIATILLTLAIPCSAQLGVVLGILGSISGRALVTWLITIVTVMACTGIILNSFIKGNPVFAMELPPLRLPDARNILVKTGRRVEWYLKEALPLFVIGTFILFVLDETGLLGLLIKTVAPLNRLLDLPDQMSEVFVMGFLRRDYGAAGMYALFQQGILNSRQTVVAAVVITLFVPCIAQTFITIRERGGKVAGLAFASVFCIAYIVGFLVNNILKILGIF
jgi:ferrous iron transport protein B